MTTISRAFPLSELSVVESCARACRKKVEESGLCGDEGLRVRRGVKSVGNVATIPRALPLSELSAVESCDKACMQARKKNQFCHETVED